MHTDITIKTRTDRESREETARASDVRETSATLLPDRDYYCVWHS